MTSQSSSRRILIYAAVCGGLGVCLGSIGAHGLDSILQQRDYDAAHIAKRLDQFDVGVRYHLYHSLALLALSAVQLGSDKGRLRVAHLFLLGILLFSGSLYLLVLSDIGKFGMVTPFGGVCLIAGWVMLLTLRPVGQREPHGGD